MRWLYAVFLVMMLGFAAVQYNDPDGPLWMLLYGAVAVWCAIALWRPGMLRGTPVLLGLAAASIAVFGLGFLWEIRSYNPEYLACRSLSGRSLARLLGPSDLERARRLSCDVGGWLVAGSRALPLLPEIVACAAGLVRMSPRRFFPALACGALPTGLAFATLEHLGSDRPIAMLLATTLIPLALWLVVWRLVVRPLRPGNDPLQH